MSQDNEKMIYLETERLILRDYRKDDFFEYYRLKSDPETMYYLQDIQMFTKEEAYADFHMVLEDMKKPDRKLYFLHIELKDTHESKRKGSYSRSYLEQNTGFLEQRNLRFAKV